MTRAVYALVFALAVTSSSAVPAFGGGASLLTDHQLQISAGASVTFSSRATEFYADNAGANLNILMGSARILSDGSTKIICTGQVLDPIGDPPSSIVPLPGFSKTGAIR